MAPTAELTAPEAAPAARPAAIEKVSIIISKGTLEGIYPGLIMANGARIEGIEANVFFTFFGMDAVVTAKQDRIKVATVGNPALGHRGRVLRARRGRADHFHFGPRSWVS